MAITMEEPETISYRYASFQLRLAAFLLDMLVLVACFALFFTLAGLQLLLSSDFGEIDPPDWSLITFVTIVAGFFPFVFFPLYFIVPWAFWGQTIGKMALGIKVLRPNGQRVGIWRAALRLVGYFFSTITLFAGFVMAATNPQKKALHDRLADTIVVETVIETTPAVEATLQDNAE